MPSIAGTVFENSYTQEDVLALKQFGLLAVSKDKSIIRPRPIAYSLLKDAGFDYSSDAKPQTHPKVMARRNIASQILYTFQMAGISVFNNELSRFIDEPLYIASFAARQKDKGNPFGSTRFYGIFCTSQEAFLVFHVDNFGLFYHKELGLFHNFIEITGIDKRAVIMMGKSTSEIAADVLTVKKDKGKENNPFKTETFTQVFETTTLPVHFIPMGDAGAQILKFLLNPNYREATARAVLDTRYRPIYEGMTDTDTIHPKAPNYPAVVAVDMDVNRIDRALASARKAGFEKIILYALKEQIPFLKSRYANKGDAEIFGVNIDHIKKLIGFDIELREPPTAAYVTNEGRCFNVSDLTVNRKVGKQD